MTTGRARPPLPSPMDAARGAAPGVDVRRPGRARGAGRIVVLAALGLLAATAGGPVRGTGSPAPDVPAVAPACPARPSLPAEGPAPAAAELTVLAAASLRDILPPLAAAWGAEHPGARLVASTDASSTLRARIEAGAPADLFAAAGAAETDALAAACRVLAGPVAFATAPLALAVAAGNPAGITGLADLARPGLRVVGTAPAVPIAGYAAAVLAAAAADQPDPAAWRAAVAANTVSEEDNVRAALAKVVLGEADAALVYATDLAGEPAAAAIAIPATWNVHATFTAVVPDTAAHPMEGAALLAFLGAPEGRAIVATAGFGPPPAP